MTEKSLLKDATDRETDMQTDDSKSNIRNKTMGSSVVGKPAKEAIRSKRDTERLIRQSSGVACSNWRNLEGGTWDVSAECNPVVGQALQHSPCGSKHGVLQFGTVEEQGYQSLAKKPRI
jgi:hypothetical protein